MYNYNGDLIGRINDSHQWLCDYNVVGFSHVLCSNIFGWWSPMNNFVGWNHQVGEWLVWFVWLLSLQRHSIFLESFGAILGIGQNPFYHICSGWTSSCTSQWFSCDNYRLPIFVTIKKTHHKKKTEKSGLKAQKIYIWMCMDFLWMFLRFPMEFPEIFRHGMASYHCRHGARRLWTIRWSHSPRCQWELSKNRQFQLWYPPVN